MRALNRHVERVFDPDRKGTHWGQRNGHGIGDASKIPDYFYKFFYF
jgi:hypothetical protein